MPHSMRYAESDLKARVKRARAVTERDGDDHGEGGTDGEDEAGERRDGEGDEATGGAGEASAMAQWKGSELPVDSTRARTHTQLLGH